MTEQRPRFFTRANFEGWGFAIPLLKDRHPGVTRIQQSYRSRSREHPAAPSILYPVVYPNKSANSGIQSKTVGYRTRSNEGRLGAFDTPDHLPLPKKNLPTIFWIENCFAKVAAHFFAPTHTLIGAFFHQGRHGNSARSRHLQMLEPHDKV